MGEIPSNRSGRPGSNRRRSAWKADALPTELRPRVRRGIDRLAGAPEGEPSQGNPGRLDPEPRLRWRVMDSNHRRLCRQIYSLLPLAARATLRVFCFLPCFAASRLPFCCRTLRHRLQNRFFSGLLPLDPPALSSDGLLGLPARVLGYRWVTRGSARGRLPGILLVPRVAPAGSAELTRGLEPLTPCLQGRCSTD